MSARFHTPIDEATGSVPQQAFDSMIDLALARGERTVKPLDRGRKKEDLGVIRPCRSNLAQVAPSITHNFVFKV